MRILMGILCLAFVFSPGLGVGDGWTLAQGAAVVENLGNIVETATLEGQFQFYIPKTGQTHLLLYYVTQEYRKQPFQILDIILDSSNTRVIEAVQGRPGPHGTLLHSNGKIYIGSGKPGYFMVYDPATGQTREIKKLADTPGAQYIIEGDDGAVYLGECIKGCVERYDPKDDSWENYGIMDDPGPPYYRYAYTLGADGRYVYVGMGQNPWYLVIYDRVNKSQKVYWKEQKPGVVTVYRGKDGGWFALCKREGKESWYALKGGQPELLMVKPAIASGPVTQLADKLASPFEVDLDRAIPDTGNRGQVTVRWRRGPTQAWQETSAQLRMAPMDIKRLYAAPDAKLFGFTSFYGPVFTYDPGKRALTILGRPQRSLYDALFEGGEWFIVGYPSATMRYNPARPWNLTASTKDLYGVMVNPRLMKVAPAGAAKYHYYLASGADGSLYFGGHHERTGVGGSLGWFNPKTGVTGGLREPFLNYDVSDLVAAEAGSKIVFSSHGVKGIDGKIFVFDVKQKKLTGEFAPLPGVSDTGKLLEIAPGMIIGVVAQTPKSIIYKADLKQGQVIWKKEVTGQTFGKVRGFDRRLIKGPDGRIWLYLNNIICRLDPADGSLQEVFAAPPAGNLLFVGNDLYIYGGTELRKVSDILRTGEK